MSLERQRPTPSHSHCIEAGCDRSATQGDERCELHQLRLGRRPSQPSVPRVASTMVVDVALDAPVPSTKATAPRPRDYWLGLGGWALGASVFFAFPLLGPGLPMRGALETAFIVLWFACGALATFGAGWGAARPYSRGKRAVGTLLALLTGIPTLLAALAGLVAFLSL